MEKSDYMRYRVAIVHPAGTSPRDTVPIEGTRLAGVAAALREVGLDVVGVPWAHETAADVRAALADTHAAIVWVNPFEAGRDRLGLDAILEEAAARGVVVSAHPETIRKIGTKEVLHRTRSMGWGSDTALYPTVESLRHGLPRRLAAGDARVLKQERGNGGLGVWKVEAAEPNAGAMSSLPLDARVRIRHAKRGAVEETTSLGELLRRFERCFVGGGRLVDQAYVHRLTDGMVRCYLVGDRVAGFGEQRVNALHPSAPGADPATAPEPGPRVYFPPDRSDFQPLKQRLENEWVAELCRTVELDAAMLPVIWDADFLYGPKDASGADTFVLCEINVSSVFPFPDEALQPLAKTTLARLQAGHG